MESPNNQSDNKGSRRSQKFTKTPDNHPLLPRMDSDLSGSHSHELLTRIQMLERELHRVRADNEQDQSVLVDKFSWLETQFWTMQEDARHNTPILRHLDEQSMRNEELMKKIIEMVGQLEERVKQSETKVTSQHNTLATFREQTGNIRRAIDMNKVAIDAVVAEMEKTKVVMSRMASVADILKK